MKKTILTIAFVATVLFSSSLVLSSCGNTSSSEDTHEHMEGDQHGDMDHSNMNHGDMEMADATYACPMHPEITGVKGDKCSICNMDLEEVETEE
ncbi:heavy metal-binding domain-containing protein [Jiulongibacter sediminis]|uniref:heavy metal-binding domain-containing protein n=1 Tax=Jiulongibacter sediminis TaxID=1605367 RepID=UPI0006DC9F2F|nr:heavy metal-binding domain-containing protein [Jiulongibacter sediminis]